MTTGLAVKFFSVLFLILAYIVYKPPPGQAAEEEEVQDEPETPSIVS